MAHRVAWSSRALQDLEAIAGYIASDSLVYAKTVVRNIVRQTRMLNQFPRAGRKVPEFDNEDVRELLVYSYRVIYRIEDERVVVAAIISREADLAITGLRRQRPHDTRILTTRQEAPRSG